MASLWTRPESKNLWACFVDAAGVRRKRSTGTADRRVAQGIADGWEAPARRRQAHERAARVVDRIKQLHAEFGEPSEDEDPQPGAVR